MAKKARLKTVQVGFTAGELDPVLLGRIDKELYYKGAALLRNVAVNPQGHITRRPGTEYIDTTTNSAASQSIEFEFNKILEEEKIVKIAYQSTEISDTIKKNFSFVWYQFYKFIFIFTNRWRKELGDLETFIIGVLVFINAVENKTFKIKEFNRKKYITSIQGSDERGVNAMSLAEITGIPRSTVIRKFDKSLATIPNFQFAEKAVINQSEISNRRIDWMIGLEYKTTSDQLEKVRNDIIDYIKSNEEFIVSENTPCAVNLNQFSASSIDILVRCFTNSNSWSNSLEVKERLAIEIKQIVEKNGASFAFPSQSIYIEKK